MKSKIEKIITKYKAHKNDIIRGLNFLNDDIQSGGKIKSVSPYTELMFIQAKIETLNDVLRIMEEEERETGRLKEYKETLNCDQLIDDDIPF